MTEVKTQFFVATMLIAGSIVYKNWDVLSPAKTWYEYRSSMYGTKIGYLPLCRESPPASVKIITRWKTAVITGRLHITEITCEDSHAIYKGIYKDVTGCEGSFRLFKSKRFSNIEMWSIKNCGEIQHFDIKLYKKSGKRL